MFSRLEKSPPAAEEIEFFFAGEALRGHAGMSLAAALLANGRSSWRKHPLSGEARGPVCLMGVCFECLVEVEGTGSVLACLTPLRPGMSVRPHSPPTVAAPPA